MKTEGVTAFPLCWPEGWPRTPGHKRKAGSQFRSGSAFSGFGDQRTYTGMRQVTFSKASSMLFEEMGRLKATGLVISTNARTRQDGGVYATDAEKRYDDPGVAIYFTYKGKPMVMAQDAYDGLASNLRSLGLAVEHMRGLERHGGGQMMERAFSGFAALPPPEGSKPKRPWFVVMGYPLDPAEREDLSLPEIEARYRNLAKKRHPDVEGGSHDAMTELGQAWEDARGEYGNEG